MNRLLKYSLACACLLALASVPLNVNGQVTPPATPPTQPQQLQQAQQPQSGTPSGAMSPFAAMQNFYIANIIGSDNQAEIALNEFASQKASNGDVKSFIQEMIRDHNDLAKKLTQAEGNLRTAAFSGARPYTASYGGQGNAPETPRAGTPGAVPGQTNAAPETNRPVPGLATPGTSTAGQGAARALANNGYAGQAGGPGVAGPNSAMTAMRFNPLSFHQEVNGKCLSLTEQQLDQKKGADFDRCFLSGQIAMHTDMLATLDVAKDQVSSQLRPVLDEALQVTQKHLSRAESLAKQLESQEKQ